MIIDNWVLQSIFDVLGWQANRKNNILILIDQLFCAIKFWSTVDLVVVFSIAIDVTNLRIRTVLDGEGILCQKL